MTSKSTEKRPIDLKVMHFGVRNCMHTAQQRDFWRTLMNAALNFWFP